MKRIALMLLAALLLISLGGGIEVGRALAEASAAKLVCCEYAIFGGMENEDTTYTARRLDGGSDAVLTLSERGVARECPLPWGTMDDLADFMALYDPAGWSSLPDREAFALDAPTRRIVLTYDDGAEYTVDNDRAIDGPLLGEALRFLDSYLATGAETFELALSSFEGGGPEYRPVLTAPEKVWISRERAYDAPEEELIAPGSGYTETLTFHGRIPGRTELRIEMSGPLVPVPVDEAPPTVYVLEVDDDYNVTLIDGTASGEY